jgi:hypothetical protein
MKTIKAKVHRLPTKEKGAWICKRKSDGYLEYVGKGYGNAQNSAWTDLHLYITTDEEIKEGDWVHHKEYGIRHYVNKDLTPEAYKSKGWKKIIATTDPKLNSNQIEPYDTSKPYGIEFPQIPQDFIKAYCEQGGIDEVLVEYVLNPTRHTHLKPRTINNTIIIHPVEEKMYSREEVKLLVTMALQWNGRLTVEFIDKWIEENL